MRNSVLLLILICFFSSYWVVPLFSENNQNEPVTVRLSKAEAAIEKLQSELAEKYTELTEQRRENWRNLNNRVDKLTGDVGTSNQRNEGKLSRYQRELAALKQEVLSFLPVGTILPYKGRRTDRLPEGWVFCDGSRSGVPNLKGYFLRGALDTSSGHTGGKDEIISHNHYISSHSHKISSHKHSFTTDSAYPGTRVFNNANIVPGDWSFATAASDKDLFHSHTGTTNIKSSFNTGSDGEGYTSSGGKHDNRPKYYTVHYIMKIK